MTIREWKWRIPGHQARVAAVVLLVLASTAKGNESASMKKSMIRACQIPSMELSNYYEGGEKTKREMKSFIEMEYKTLSNLNRTNANPHLVALVLDDEQFCSGTLISESFVLTSAHCTNNVKKIEMIFGTEDMTMDDAGVQKRTEYSTAVYEHPSYDKASGSNDISLIRLSKPVFITKFVKAVRIPDLAQLDASVEGLDAEVAGWSESTLEGGKVYSESNSKKVRLASNSACRSIHSSVNDQKMMCSKDVTRNELCQADAGSPVTARCDMSAFKKSRRTIEEGAAVAEGTDDVFGDEGRCEFFDNCEDANEDPLEGLGDDENDDDALEGECKSEEECKNKKMALRQKMAMYRTQRKQENKLSRNVHKLCQNCKKKDPENFCFLFYHYSALENATNSMSKADPAKPVRPNRPASRPNKPAGANRPNKPGAANRPNKPAGANRPNKPGAANRPNKPGAANRPSKPSQQGRPNRPVQRPNKPAQKPVTLAKRPGKPSQQGRPNKPAGRPNKPAGRPNKPAGRPNKPAGRPNKPAGRPNKPGASNKPSGSRKPVPGETVETPAVPVETPQLRSKQRPNNPGQQGGPNKPAGRPNKPAGRPNKPAGRPNKPAGRPNKPAGRPNKPAGRPNKPAGKPNKPSQKPLLQACDAFNRSPHVLLGITSFGSCSDGLVFTKISPYMDFIKTTLALKY